MRGEKINGYSLLGQLSLHNYDGDFDGIYLFGFCDSELEWLADYDLVTFVLVLTGNYYSALQFLDFCCIT